MGAGGLHHGPPEGWGDRYAVRSYDSTHAQQQEVVDSRTPLSVLMHGEEHERVATNRAIDAAAERIVDRLAEELGGVLSEVDREGWMDLVNEVIADEIQQTRLNTVRGLLRYCWDGALNPWGAMKKLLVITREAASHLIRGVSQTEVAFIVGETKAATSAREKKFEEMLGRWGVKGRRLVGGGKSDEAREVYRQIRKGNKSRKKGQRRKNAEKIRRGTRGGGDE